MVVPRLCLGQSLSIHTARVERWSGASARGRLNAPHPTTGPWTVMGQPLMEPELELDS